jgi:hypothetical protein
MNDDSKEIFNLLKSEVTRLHYYWIVYRQILGASENRIHIVNKTTPSFFILYQDLMIEYITLELSKLTDPINFGKNKNLSFYYLLEQIKDAVATEFNDRLIAILNKLKSSTELFRKRRNKIVAHNDVNYVFQKDTFGISRQNVEEALKDVREFMNEIELHYFNNQTLYEEFITNPASDGIALLIRLSKSLAYDELVKQQKISRDLWEDYGKVY